MKRLLPLVILISVIFTLASPSAFALDADGRAQPEVNAPRGDPDGEGDGDRPL